MRQPAYGWRAVLSPGLLAVLSMTVFLLVYYLTVRTVPGRRLGDRTLRGADLSQSGTTDTVQRILDIVSVTFLLGTVAAVAIIALIRLKRARGLAAIAVLATANIATWILKRVVLSRPDLGLAEITPATWNSLPSGHTTAAFSAVAALLFVIPTTVRIATATAGITYVSLTAIATMSAGWHRAGDSIAAFFLVATLAAIGGTVIAMIGELSAPEPSSIALTGRTRRRFALTTAAFLTPGLILALSLTARGPMLDSETGYIAALAASTLLVIGTAIAATTVILSVIDGITPAEPANPTVPASDQLVHPARQEEG